MRQSAGEAHIDSMHKWKFETMHIRECRSHLVANVNNSFVMNYFSFLIKDGLYITYVLATYPTFTNMESSKFPPDT